MRWISTAAAGALLLTACNSHSEAAKSSPQSVREQVEANWLPPYGANCQQAILVRTLFEPDGTIERLEVLEMTPDDKGCVVVVETIRRALALSNPLKFPGKAPASLVLRFRPETWAAR